MRSTERMPPLLYLLACCNLVIGTGAFGLTGILTLVADSLGVSVAVAGQSMTAYAMATAFLAPLMLVATGRWSRRGALQAALALYAAGLLVCALAPSIGWLMLGRVMMGAGAVLTPVAASIAISVVEPARRGQALSLTFLGQSLSYVIGIPLGAWLGARFGWRMPVAALVAAALLMLALVSLRVPRDIRAPGASFQGLGALLVRSDVLRLLSMTLLYFGAIFSVFAYIGPVLQKLSPMSAERLSFTLMLFGCAGVVGTLSGGWANDRFGALRTLRVQITLLTAMMLLVPLSQGHYGFMVAVFMVWGVAGYGMMMPTQSRLAGAAPAQAPMLLSLNSSMLYLGTALGAATGGIAGRLIGFESVAWVGAALTALAALTLVGSRGR